MDITNFLENIINDGRANLPVDLHDDFLRALHHSLSVPSKNLHPRIFRNFWLHTTGIVRSAGVAIASSSLQVYTVARCKYQQEPL